jgi:hypothetical protein
MQGIVTINKNVFYSKSEKPSLEYKSVKEVLDLIYNNDQKDIILKIRESEKPEQDKLKKTLVGIMWSGKFTGRLDADLVEHSGIICLDFDKLGEDMAKFYSKLINDKYTYSLFVSPSGNGLKVLVKIPNVIKDHKLHFKALEKYYGATGKFDPSSINPARICYISYDPNVYINEDSELFTDKIKQEDYSAPYSSDKTINILLNWWNKKYGIKEGNRNNNCFILACAFNEYGIDEDKTINFFLDFVRQDFPKTEILSLVRSAYSKKSKFNTKYFDVLNEKEEIVIDTTKQVSGIDFKAIFKDAFIDIDKKYQAPPICLSIGTKSIGDKTFPVRFGTESNFSAIVGQSKSKKSFFKSLLIASYIGCDSKYSGNITSHRNKEGYIIDIDTEQGEYDAHRCFSRVQKMVGASISDFYKPFALRPYSAKERIQFIDWLVYESDYRNDLLWMAIDGMADLVENFNDVNESNKAIQKVMEWTNNKKMHINTVIHANYGSEKATGHLGTAILKKAETICNLYPAGEFVNVKFAYTRGYPIEDIQYEVNEFGLPTVTGNKVFINF